MNVAVNTSRRTKHQADLTVRKNLDFGLHDDLPRYWFGNDPFKTRVLEALAMTFPIGERYFISSVRLFRDQITDPVLQAKVKDFIAQEAQHGIAHDVQNDILRRQGIPVEALLANLNGRFEHWLKHNSPQFNIAHTAAAEHLTALMAACFFSQQHTLADAHPNMRALIAWHAIEEMEHRDVAFDVMEQVSNTSYAMRAATLALVGLFMPTFTLMRTHKMLKIDGFSTLEQVKIFRHGLPWLFGKQGILAPMKQPFFDWFKRDFHPSQHPIIAQYDVWVNTLAETGDPVQAGQAFWQAAR